MMIMMIMMIIDDKKLLRRDLRLLYTLSFKKAGSPTHGDNFVRS